jgi:hypothetical protein
MLMVTVLNDNKKEAIPLDESDDELIRVAMNLPRWLHRALKRTSAIIDESASSIVRRALEKELRRLESLKQISPIMPPLKVGKKEEALEEIESPRIDDGDLKRVLDSCSTFFGGFELDGEDGFVNVFGSLGWKLKDLTSEQRDIVIEKIVAGWKGYDEPLSEEDWLAKFEPLGLDDDWVERLSYSED